MFFSRLPEIADVRLEGKTVIVTGANSGIGFETAIDLAKRGAKVIIGCRNVEAGEKAVVDIKEQSKSDSVYLIRLDLASLKSVRAFAKEFLEKENDLHILINNAGVMAMPRTLSEDGYEMQFAVNHLGHFLLTTLLLDALKKSVPSRIVTVSSDGHKLSHKFDFEDINLEKNYSSWRSYARSKLCNVLFTKELHRRYHKDGISAYTLQPGVVATNLARHSVFSNWFLGPLLNFFAMTPVEGAQTTIFCAVQPDIEEHSGEYYKKRVVDDSSGMSKEIELAEQIWQLSLDLTKEESKQDAK